MRLASRFVLRDDFSGPPDPGYRAITGSGLVIGGGKCVFPGATGSAIYWTPSAADSIARIAGRAVVAWLTSSSGTHYLSAYNSTTRRSGWYVSSGVAYTTLAPSTTYMARYHLADSPNATHRLAMVLQAAGVDYYYADDFCNRLVWFEESSSFTDFKFGTPDANANTQLSALEVSDQGAQSWRNYRTLDQASPANSTTYTPSTVGDELPGTILYEFDVTAPSPLSGSIDLYPKYIDSDNYYKVSISSAGSVSYTQRVNGANSTDTTDAGVVTAGDVLKVYFRWDTYRHLAYVFRSGTPIAQGDLYLLRGRRQHVDVATGVQVVATDFVCSRIQAFPLVASGNPLNVQRTAPSIFAVGDSKTQTHTWPETLVSDLCTAVGRQWVEHPGRLAQGGWTVTDVKNAIDGGALNTRLAGGAPNHILISLGTNDAGTSPTEATWKAEYRAIIEACHTAYPNATIYLAKPVRLAGTPPSTPLATVATIHSWIADLVGEYSYVFDGPDETALEGGDAYATNFADNAHFTSAGNTANKNFWKTILGY
jgi:lysophospholipase L1-like esterase